MPVLLGTFNCKYKKVTLAVTGFPRDSHREAKTCSIRVEILRTVFSCVEYEDEKEKSTITIFENSSNYLVKPFLCDIGLQTRKFHCSLEFEAIISNLNVFAV